MVNEKIYIYGIHTCLSQIENNPENINKIYIKNSSLNKNLQAYKDWVPYPYEHYVCDREIEDSGYQIQETQPGGFYKWHHDGLGSRMLTFIWYLNDITEGGYTEFNTGFKVQPQTGKLVIFPGLWPWVHRGVAPKSEVKYLCTGWVSEKPIDMINTEE